MKLVVRTATAEAELEVGALPAAPVVSVGALVERVTGRPAPARVWIDGRPSVSATPLDRAGLARGSIIDVTAAGAHAAEAASELVVVAGPGAGRRRLLAPGRYRLGPGRGEAELADGVVAQPAVHVVAPARQARLLDLDDRVLLLRPAPRAPEVGAGPPPGTDGTLAFNRPPRPAPEPEPPPIVVPDGAGPTSDPRRFPLLAALVPIPAAVALAAAIGQWRFLLIGLASPLMLVANWFEERRSGASERRRASAADASARQALREELARRHATDGARARRAAPSIAEALTWLHQAAPELWARRPHHRDAFVVPLGVGDEQWRPALEQGGRSLHGVEALVQELGPLRTVPITADLNVGGIGLCGPPAATRAAGAGIVLAVAALHGPADLEVLVCAEAHSAGDWEWIKWLPHARRASSALLTDPAAAVSTARDLAARADRDPGAPRVLVVADGDLWWHGVDAPLRALLDRGVADRLVALCPDRALVPAVCSTIVDVRATGRGRVEDVSARRTTMDVALNRVDTETALGAARAVARRHDPEHRAPVTSRLPTTVSLLDLLAVPLARGPGATVVERRWLDPARRPRVPIGLGEAGAVSVDLVTDGPHGLIAGTTGAGKSELLRTIVVGLAAALPPDELNLLLFDFKGGAAFDECAGLPHSVGLITDLDEHLAGRVLRSLRAELTHRERVLRNAQISSLDEAGLGDRTALLPRLVIVVDEFASLSAQLPEFLPGVVDIAQRGRSLGVHLLLATQRPAGVVDAKIRANTNLRVALRVQDDGDSLDVIGTRAAASLPRHLPGRALVRFGAGELVELQTAIVGAVPSPASAAPAVRVTPFVVARPLSCLERRVVAGARHDSGDDGHGDDRDTFADLVGVITEAARTRPAPRRPYVDPLPDRVERSALARAERPPASGPRAHPGVAFALEDRPDEQRQRVRNWYPGEGSSLTLFGMIGSGATSTLVSLVLGAAGVYGPDDLHVYAVDADTGRLAPLAGLPHTGAVVGLDEPARLVRLARLLGRELERRRRLSGAGGDVTQEPVVLLVIDNLGSLRHDLELERDRAELWSVFERLLREGPGFRIVSVVSATTERALPSSASAATAERLVLRLPDASAYAALGLRPADVPTMVPGRAVCLRERSELQVVAPPADLGTAVAQVAGHASVTRPPIRVDPLPARVEATDIVGHARRGAEAWSLPVGVDLHEGRIALLEVRPGAPVAVCGPPRSGRSNVLVTLAVALRAVDPELALYAAAPGPGPLLALARAPRAPREVAPWVEELVADRRRRVLIVDDADGLGGPSFERLATLQPPDLSVVVAGAADSLGRLRHWSRPWLRSRRGILLAPGPGDGDALGVTLPAHLGRWPPGHGLLVDDGELLPILCARAPQHE